PVDVARWIEAGASLHAAKLGTDAVAALASAVGSDTERIEQEGKKLGAYAAGAAVTAADVRALVSGAIEADVFELTQAVVRQDARVAIGTLERLLADGNAPQQILALLLWQFRVLLFASAMRSNADAERMAKAIRSTPGAIARATAFARRVTRADIVRAYEAIYATDQVIKTGRADSDVAALMLCVLDLCGSRTLTSATCSSSSRRAAASAWPRAPRGGRPPASPPASCGSPRGNASDPPP